MTASALFGRAYSLSIQTAQGSDALVYTNVGDKAAPLRIAFDVQKNVKSTPNKAVIAVYNLSARTRSSIGKSTLVTLAVGYTGMVQNLFLGVVQKATSEQNGSDIITKLECGDGEPALSGTPFKMTFPPGTQIWQVFKACAEAMNLASPANPQPINAGVGIGIPAGALARGYTAEGLAKDTLDDLCRSCDLQWSIQNGALDIVPIGAHTGDTADVLKPSTGLLGIPSLNGKTVTFQALIQPGIAPNRLVEIQSTSVRGFFKISSVKATGDTHDSKWQMECEGSLMSAAAAEQELPAAVGFDYNTAQA
jgi:hypothetical protein